jgi:phage FluMu protein Com
VGEFKERMRMSEAVKCPSCQRRLFDKLEDTSGAIEIKCPACRKVIKIRLERGVEKKTYKSIPSNGTE